MVSRYRIMVETVEGNTFEAFTWVGDPARGIRRASTDAALFGYDIRKIWAVVI